jgi:hypothetical protein
MTARPRAAAPRRSPAAFEILESRQLLASGFLQGIAFTDANHNGGSDPGEGLNGARIDLYLLNPDHTRPTTPLATQATGTNSALPDGGYQFTGLAAGTYQIVETPPTGYASTGTQTLSQLDPASSPDAQTIEVTLLDSPLNVTFSSDEFFARNKWDVLSYSLYGTPSSTSIGQLPVTVSSPTYTTPKFLSLCVDLNHDLPDGINNFPIAPDTSLPATAVPANAPAGASLYNAGRIAYLYNHYGIADLSKQDAVGLQVAIWELEYDNGTTPDFTGPASPTNNFGRLAGILPYTNATETAAILGRASFYWNDSQNKNELA